MSDDRTPNPFGESREVAVRPAGALISVEQQRAVAETQARYLIARSNPRDPLRAMDAIIQDCTRQSLAETALYAYNRGGTDITGPTIRLAEALARRWGNIASGIKEVSRHGEYSECIAYAHDLETGFYDERQFQVRHWRDTKKGGYRITDERDIYEMIANFGQRRKRAVLLSVIPGDVVEAAIEQCERTLHTKADTSPEGLKKMLDIFSSVGVTREQIEARCQRRIEALHPAQVVQLRKIFGSIRDGMSEARDWFNVIDVEAEAEPQRGNAGLRGRLRKSAPEPESPEPANPSDGKASSAPQPAPQAAPAHDAQPAREPESELPALTSTASQGVERPDGQGVSLPQAEGADGRETDIRPGNPVDPGDERLSLSPRLAKIDLALRTTAEGGLAVMNKLFKRQLPADQKSLAAFLPEYEAIARRAIAETP